jgi:hypothetical protein
VALALIEVDGNGIVPRHINSARLRDGCIAEGGGGSSAVLEHELLVIDLAGDGGVRDVMARAASEWGFFHVTNHGLSQALLEEMRRAVRVQGGRRPARRLLPVDHPDSHVAPAPLVVSEAFHVQLDNISGNDCNYGKLHA